MTEYITMANDAKNITGQRFGQLIALGPVDRQRGGIIWLCQCDCGNHARVKGALLRSGKTRSCGCLHRRIASDRLTTHGLHKDKNYGTWLSIIKRCESQSCASFPDYGGRGIQICAEWRHNFEVFLSYISSLPNYGIDEYQLDRIDNNGNYEPGNVRWASRKQQCRNTRRNVLLTHNGKTQCVAAWAEETGLTPNILHHRLYAGWPIEQALTTPPRSRG